MAAKLIRSLVSSLVAVVIKGLMIWGSKCHQNNSPVECGGYVEYEEAEVHRLVAILKTNNCGGGGEGCLIITVSEYSNNREFVSLLH